MGDRRREILKKLLFSPLFFMYGKMLGEHQKPHILILGDSIAKGYFPFVQEALRSDFMVSRPINRKGIPINCMDTKTGLSQLHIWLNEKKWDLVHFNFGLHDLKHVNPETGKGSRLESHPLNTDVETYATNLDSIVKIIKRSSKRRIFATTTPVPAALAKSPMRRSESPEIYNRVAENVMDKHNVPIDDLYSVGISIPWLQRKNDVHFKENGYRILGEQVVRSIKKQF